MWSHLLFISASSMWMQTIKYVACSQIRSGQRDMQTQSSILYAETDSNSKAKKGKKRSRSKWNQSPAILILFVHKCLYLLYHSFNKHSTVALCAMSSFHPSILHSIEADSITRLGDHSFFTPYMGQDTIEARWFCLPRKLGFWACASTTDFFSFALLGTGRQKIERLLDWGTKRKRECLE
uniref:Uncharacterized protein n=1 Tax=Utricularia reniformis TaxID=192314 RepID=A0A1Y0B314_9LAMI|nr:hypothetical protein AEK19_MT1638 [Utricularia reniformis]ART31822.1 hypothetical protein AEK19_MT1638 [Utricularia reniformis]